MLSGFEVDMTKNVFLSFMINAIEKCRPDGAFLIQLKLGLPKLRPFWPLTKPFTSSYVVGFTSAGEGKFFVTTDMGVEEEGNDA